MVAAVAAGSGLDVVFESVAALVAAAVGVAVAAVSMVALPGVSAHASACRPALTAGYLEPSNVVHSCSAISSQI